jgi:hypothetical protein
MARYDGLRDSHSWRYSVGLTPHTLRNIRAKCCCVLKPQATATSNIRPSGARNNSYKSKFHAPATAVHMSMPKEVAALIVEAASHPQ